jgi:hypothetical protein
MSRRPLLVDVAIAVPVAAAVLVLVGGLATVVLLALAILVGLGISGLAHRISGCRRDPHRRRRGQPRHFI